MSIRPPSDLVLDAVRAADPARASALSRKLASADAGGGAFDVALRAASARTTFSTASSSSAAVPSKVGAGLEELLLTQLTQSMLPKDAASIYGSGSAGSIWRGMMAEHLARSMARSGAVGLAAKLEPAPSVAAATPAEGA
jgi:Rod binding domain-containing protein